MSSGTSTPSWPTTTTDPVAPCPYRRRLLASDRDRRGDDLGWNPWRELAARPHIRLGIRHLPEGTGGGIYARRGRRAAIIIDRRLTQTERNAALTHELVHDERGGGTSVQGMPPAWAPVVRRDEQTVHRETARRLVPLDQLADFCDRQADLGQGVSPDDVAEEFDVPRWVAEHALDNLTRHERDQP